MSLELHLKNINKTAKNDNKTNRFLSLYYFIISLKLRSFIMKKLTILLRIVGVLQIVLGLLYLFAPSFMLTSMGHTLPKPDIFYPLAMLSARFISYGIAFIYISKEPIKHKLWIYFMILIQTIDLSAGIFYTAIGVVSLKLSGFPMFNAGLIIILLYLFTKSEIKRCSH